MNRLPRRHRFIYVCISCHLEKKKIEQPSQQLKTCLKKDYPENVDLCLGLHKVHNYDQKVGKSF